MADTDRPAYCITVEDFGDRVRWDLQRDEEDIATGFVEVEGGNVDAAFTAAWMEATAERRQQDEELI